MKTLTIASYFFVFIFCGCGRMEGFAEVNERPAALENAPGCDTAQGSPRGAHYRAQLDMGERPDSSSSSSSVSAVRRSVTTAEVESGFSMETAFLIVEILAFIALLILMLLALDRKHPKRRRTLLLTACSAGATLVFGFLAGSVLSLDNPTNWPVRVDVDGTLIEVPPHSFTDVRVRGPNVAIATETVDRSPLERLELSLDDNPLQTLTRATFGDGRYVYSVCGSATYSLGQYSYE